MSSKEDHQQLYARIRAALEFIVLAVLAIVIYVYFPRFETRQEFRIMAGPFEEPWFKEDASGHLRGGGYDAYEEAARRAGIQLVWVRIKGERADAVLESGRTDGVAIAVKTPERTKRFYFTEPWYEDNFVLISKADTPIEEHQKGIILHRGSFGSETVMKRAFSNANTKVVPYPEDLVDAYCSGKGDHLVMEFQALHSALLRSPVACAGKPMEAHPVEGSTIEAGLMASHEMAPVAKRLREALGEMIEDGEYARILGEWSHRPRYDEQLRRTLAESRFQERLLQGILGAMVLITAGWGWVQFRLLRRRSSQADSTAKA